MPELPEVETIVRDLKRKVLERTFLVIWTDFKKTIKKPKDFNQFKGELKGKKILDVFRRGKNIIFTLSNGYSLLVHQKLTGHLLIGKWKLVKGKWQPLISGPLSDDKANGYIHVMFCLDKDLMLGLSDVRKFAKIELWKTDELFSSKEMKSLGPEPLSDDFTLEKLVDILKNKKAKIKQVLMDQNVIAGIGNIYSDEILYRAKIHPFRKTSDLKRKEIEAIYLAMKDVLKKAIDLKGESFSDFRTLYGEKGGFDTIRLVYQREKEKCSCCGTEIKRLKMGSRSSYFCPKCQK